MRVFDRCDGELGECTGERRWRSAKVKASSATRTAASAMAEGIKCDAIADLEICDARADFDDFAGGFVTENHREPRDHPLRAEFPIDDMQIGAAYAARADAN
jgi:hypothetical protein